MEAKYVPRRPLEPVFITDLPPPSPQYSIKTPAPQLKKMPKTLTVAFVDLFFLILVLSQ
jgi:hypothetical protein